MKKTVLRVDGGAGARARRGLAQNVRLDPYLPHARAGVTRVGTAVLSCPRARRHSTPAPRRETRLATCSRSAGSETCWWRGGSGRAQVAARDALPLSRPSPMALCMPPCNRASIWISRGAWCSKTFFAIFLQGLCGGGRSTTSPGGDFEIAHRQSADRHVISQNDTTPTLTSGGPNPGPRRARKTGLQRIERQPRRPASEVLPKIILAARRPMASHQLDSVGGIVISAPRHFRVGDEMRFDQIARGCRGAFSTSAKPGPVST